MIGELTNCFSNETACSGKCRQNTSTAQGMHDFLLSVEVDAIDVMKLHACIEYMIYLENIVKDQQENFVRHVLLCWSCHS